MKRIWPSSVAARNDAMPPASSTSGSIERAARARALRATRRRRGWSRRRAPWPAGTSPATGCRRRARPARSSAVATASYARPWSLSIRSARKASSAQYMSRMLTGIAHGRGTGRDRRGGVELVLGAGEQDDGQRCRSRMTFLTGCGEDDGSGRGPRRRDHRAATGGARARHA